MNCLEPANPVPKGEGEKYRQDCRDHDENHTHCRRNTNKTEKNYTILLSETRTPTTARELLSRRRRVRLC